MDADGSLETWMRRASGEEAIMEAILQALVALPLIAVVAALALEPLVGDPA
ncbi:hypothetical protein GCM10023351_16690 [Microbacterium gilvum]|uniref:Uncharacterized protein n=1 Tax=Microbacterium gilvum TaxID=1336204 RepID=A0ABP9A340_9MICO